jgi:hypothetical protein
VTSLEADHAFRGDLLAVEIREDSPDCRCTWCKEWGNKYITMYIITSDIFKDGSYRIPKGFICGRCACSAAQALVLWGEEGTLF